MQMEHTAISLFKNKKIRILDFIQIWNLKKYVG